MAATVLLLLLLVLITPRLIGYREDISTLPRLIINYGEDDLIIFITSLSGTYLYEALFLNITTLDGDNLTQKQDRNSHGLQERVELNQTTQFLLDAVAEDRRRVFFETRMEVTATKGSEGWSFRLLLLPERTLRVLTENDLLNSPFATLMQKREAS